MIDEVNIEYLRAPFPYFGGKSMIADLIWRRLGCVKRYIEPFFGSGAVLLRRPDWRENPDEIICDKDGHIANVWRSIKFAPDKVAEWCDWPRVCGGNWQGDKSTCGIFFDPPYSDEKRNKNIYACESMTVAHDVREWTKKRGDNKNYRIIIAGYDGEHDELLNYGWTVETWKANGGYGNQGNGQGKENAKRERLWLSPYCLKEGDLFEQW